MSEHFDVVVVGAGVFGSWTAYLLNHAGAKVALVDAYGPGNSRASSGGESRIIRLGYGSDEIYTRSAQRSLHLWQEFSERASPKSRSENSNNEGLYRQTGVLWLAREHDTYCEATLSNLRLVGASSERLDHDDLRRRYPQIEFQETQWGILESNAGILMARRAVQALCTAAQSNGVTYFQHAVVAPQQTAQQLRYVTTASGDAIYADKFIFACGPWLPKLFPERLGDRFHITKQEVFFFGVPPGDRRFDPPEMPAWIDFNDLVYAIPNLDNRGFKLAIDAHGPEFDPDSGERLASHEGSAATRNYLARRIPALANAPVLESRVCQYENTSNGDFLIDAHPEISNAWLVGGGSGHGFKHGPAVGEYVVKLIAGNNDPEPRFSFASKQTVRDRQVY
jgi:sarcosine oxidase